MGRVVHFLSSWFKDQSLLEVVRHFAQLKWSEKLTDQLYGMLEEKLWPVECITLEAS